MAASTSAAVEETSASATESVKEMAASTTAAVQEESACAAESAKETLHWASHWTSHWRQSRIGPRTAVVLEGVPKAAHRVQHKVGCRAHLAEVVQDKA